MHARKFSSTNIELWIVPRLSSAKIPLLVLSAVAWTRKWGDLSACFSSFVSSIRALFCTNLGKSGYDCKFSVFVAGFCKNLPAVWASVGTED